jgi:hypothetical protein
MKIKDLIKLLKQAAKENGNIDVVGIADGEIFAYIDINVPDNESPLYIELAK